MNGDVKTYTLNQPVRWGVFSSWPSDIQAEYITRLVRAFGVSSSHLADMFGVSQNTVRVRRKELGISGRRGGNHTPVSPEWAVFCGMREAPEKVVEAAEKPSENVDISANVDVISCLTALLAELKDTGAKVAIEVTL